MQNLVNQKKIQKIFFGLGIIPFELVALNTRFYRQRENACHRVWIRQQTVSRFKILLKTKFSSWFTFRVIKKYDKRLPFRLKDSFGPFNMLTVYKCSDTGLLRHLSNTAFSRPYLQKQITSEAHIFFRVLQLLCRFWKCRTKFTKYFLIYR